MNTSRRRAAAALATAGLGLSWAGRGWAQAVASSTTTAGPQQLRIGFQKSAVNLVLVKQSGALEKRYPQARVQWVEFPAGPQLLEALSVGALEFGLTGDSPPVFAQAAGKDLLYVGAEPPKPLSSAILAPANSPLRELADLKGKRVALQKGSSAHYLLVRAVDRAGLKWSDITPIYLPPADARAAFEKSAVDAWAIWDPFYAAVELALKPRVLSTGAGPGGAGSNTEPLSNNNSFYLASRAFTEQHPQVLQALFDELSQADAYVAQHSAEAAQRIAEFSGLAVEAVQRFIGRRPRSPVGPIQPTMVADQQRVADAFHRLELIPKAVRVADIVWQPPKA